jgi:hypothetical protein
LVNSIIHGLPHQPRLVARSREVLGGGFWNLGRSNLRRTRSFNIYRRRSVYESQFTVYSTLWKLSHFLCRRFSVLPSLHPPCSGSRESSVSEPTLVIWDLHGCRRIRFLESALASCSFFRVFFIDDFFIYYGSTVSRSSSCSWYNDDLMDRSVVYLSHLCYFLLSNLDLCCTSVVHINC